MPARIVGAAATALFWLASGARFRPRPLRARRKFLTGALPSVGDGICVIESTWRGGRHGHLWGLVKQALETPEEQKGPLDWRLAFFPWYRILAIATHYRGHLALRPGDTSWASLSLALAPGR